MPRVPRCTTLALLLLSTTLAFSCDDDHDLTDADLDANLDADTDVVLDATLDADIDEEDAEADAGPEQHLRLMTWNLENFPLATSTIANVVELVESLDADIIAVQEIADGEAFEQLVRALPGYDGLLADDPEAFIRVGLLWRTVSVEAVGFQTLFVGDWYAFPRPPLLGRFRVADSITGNIRFDFDIMVVHLKAYLDEDSMARRRTACDRLEAWAAARLETGSEPDIIILGDWNDELTDWGTHQVFGAFLDRPESYRFLTYDLEESGEHTYIPFDSFLDHILVTNDTLAEYGEGSTEVLRLDHSVYLYEERVSDHLPVMATFELLE